MALSRPRLVYRPRKLEPADLEAALRRADFQAAAIERLTSKRRDALLNAVHLFVRASETTADWGQALLFFAAAVDVISGLAPRKRALSVHDRAAVLNATEKLFGRDDSRQVAVTCALHRVNEVSLTERLRRSARPVVIQEDRKVVVGGLATVNPGSTNEFGLARCKTCRPTSRRSSIPC